MVSDSPSAGAAMLTVTFLAVMSSSVKNCSLPLTITVSPAFAVSGRPITTATVLSAPISSAFKKPSSLPTRMLVGASGAVRSGAAALVGSDSLPALSVKVASICSPFTRGGTKVTVKSPFASTTPSPMRVPFVSVILTLVSGSPLPVTVLPSPLTATSVGASGASVSIGG